jgi:hypothetical protein
MLTRSNASIAKSAKNPKKIQIKARNRRSAAASFFSPSCIDLIEANWSCHETGLVSEGLLKLLWQEAREQPSVAPSFPLNRENVLICLLDWICPLGGFNGLQRSIIKGCLIIYKKTVQMLILELLLFGD